MILQHTVTLQLKIEVLQKRRNELVDFHHSKLKIFFISMKSQDKTRTQTHMLPQADA
jgi:hypothetical protein